MRKIRRTGNPIAGYNTVQDMDALDLDSKSRPELIQEMVDYIDSMGDSMEVSVVDAYLAKLQEGSPKFVTEDPKIEAEKILARIRRKDQPMRPRRKSAKVKLAVILAAVFAALTVIAVAGEHGPFRWFSDRVFSRQNISGNLTLPEGVEGDYSSLQDALDQNGFDVLVEPDWIPTDYSFDSATVRIDMDSTRINAVYWSEYRQFRIQVTKNRGPAGDTIRVDESVEDSPVQAYISNGFEYGIIINTDNIKATWQIGEYNCVISGELSEEEFKNDIGFFRMRGDYNAEKNC